jgi:hypothetical protein
VTGGRSTTVKHRSAGKTVATRAPLIRALRSGPLEATLTILDPPPQLKGRKAGGSGITFSAVDPGALIWAVGEMCPRFRTPPLSLKVERQGGVRNSLCAVDPGALIQIVRSCSLLTTGACCPRLWISGF